MSHSSIPAIEEILVVHKRQQEPGHQPAGVVERQVSGERMRLLVWQDRIGDQEVELVVCVVMLVPRATFLPCLMLPSPSRLTGISLEQLP